MPPKKKSSVSSSSSSLPQADDVVCWYWASDSDPSNPDKSQDLWTLFDANKSALIEAAFALGKKTVKVDAERFVDLNDWQQKRYDDPEGLQKNFLLFFFYFFVKNQQDAEELCFVRSVLWLI